MASAQAFLQSKEGYAGWDRFLGEAKVGHLKGLQLFFLKIIRAKETCYDKNVRFNNILTKQAAW